MSDLIVVRCNLCDQPTVRGESCRQCGKPLSGQELPFIAQIPAADNSDWRSNIKPAAIGYGAALLLWLFGFGKIASIFMVGITVYFAIKILREL